VVGYPPWETQRGVCICFCICICICIYFVFVFCILGSGGLPTVGNSEGALRELPAFLNFEQFIYPQKIFQKYVLKYAKSGKMLDNWMIFLYDVHTGKFVGLDLHEYVSGFVGIWPPDLSGSCERECIIFLFIWHRLDRYPHWS